MRISKNDIPTKIDVPGAVARQAINFGDASDYGSLAAEYFSLGAGTDIAPLLKGLDDDACHAPHWGFIMSGEVVITYTKRSGGGDLRRRRPLLLAARTQCARG